MAVRRYRSEISDSARWDGFAFRPGDIVISAPAKAGTTWTQMICALLIFQTPDLPAPLTSLSPWLDMRVRPIDEVCDHLQAQQHRRFIKTHTPLDGVPALDFVTYVAVCRDPRDLLVSRLHHYDNLKWDVIDTLVGLADGGTPDEPGEGDGDDAPPPGLRERALQWIDEDATPGEGFGLGGFVWQMKVAWERRHLPNVVLVHYADLTRDLEGAMRRLARRLDIDVPEASWPHLVAAAGFERMKFRADQLAPDERVGLFKDKNRFFRSAGAGEWRDLLTPEDVAHYDERLRAMAPADLVHWLHNGDGGAAVTPRSGRRV